MVNSANELNDIFEAQDVNEGQIFVCQNTVQGFNTAWHIGIGYFYIKLSIFHFSVLYGYLRRYPDLHNSAVQSGYVKKQLNGFEIPLNFTCSSQLVMYK